MIIADVIDQEIHALNQRAFKRINTVMAVMKSEPAKGKSSKKLLIERFTTIFQTFELQ